MNKLFKTFKINQNEGEYVVLEAKLTWSEPLEISKLKADLILLGKGNLTHGQFSERYRMLDNWGIYMYFLDKEKIVYIGTAISKK